ncbi:Anthranilate synthase component 1 [Buchnera aphidicola (Pterocallis alni)]
MNQFNHLYEVETIQINVPYINNPALIFHEICGNKKCTLLLESAEINKKKQLESMMIIDTAIRIIAYNKVVILEFYSHNGDNIIKKICKVLPKEVKVSYYKRKMKLIFPKIHANMDEDQKLRSLSVLDSFRFISQIIQPSRDCLKSIFWGGLFSYDLVNTFENLPKVHSIQKCPDFCFYLSEVLLIIDHVKKISTIQGSIFLNDPVEKNRIRKRLLHIKKKMESIPSTIPINIINTLPIKYNFDDVEYKKIVKKMKTYIKKGEIFQIVPSRQFFIPCIYSLSAYYRLKLNNPSPYMFFMQDIDFMLFGASPESSLKYNAHDRKIEIYPIAGTRPRGINKYGVLDLDLDGRIELEMRTNNKELSEHLMLVDLARNDLSKICIPGTRFVSHLTKVDRYSHVMHLVSKVVGILKNDLDCLHAYSACMNMGTLTGAPKIRAMQLIANAEKIKRGSYGGAIGYFTGEGNLDTCIVIRSAYIEKQIATIQAGAGIVLDSIPVEEALESCNKSKAVLNAIIQSNYEGI